MPENLSKLIAMLGGGKLLSALGGAVGVGAFAKSTNNHLNLEPENDEEPYGGTVNWKWVAAALGSIILFLLTTSGVLVGHLMASKDDQLKSLSNSIQEAMRCQTAFQATVTAYIAKTDASFTRVETNQTWVIEELKRVRTELQKHEEENMRLHQERMKNGFK